MVQKARQKTTAIRLHPAGRKLAPRTRELPPNHPGGGGLRSVQRAGFVRIFGLATAARPKHCGEHNGQPARGVSSEFSGVKLALTGAAGEP